MTSTKNQHISDPELVRKDAKYYISHYSGLYSALTTVIRDAIWVSIQAENKAGGDRRYWCSVIFIRLIATCRSLLRLCPKDTADIFGNWDFGSVASLSRNLFEGYLLFSYFSEPSQDDEWRTRLNVMQLCDCTSRIKLFKQMGRHEQAAAFQPQADDLRARLQSNIYFQSLELQRQQQLLQGIRPSLYSMRELSLRASVDDRVWGYFELLSSHTHTLPVSFYRLGEQGRTGVANEADQSYIASAIEFSIDMLQRAIEAFKKDFASLTRFQLTDLPTEQILRRKRKAIPLEEMNRSQRRAIERKR